MARKKGAVNAWNKAKKNYADNPEGRKVEDGQYVAQLSEVKIAAGKNGQMIIMSWKVKEPEDYKNSEMPKFFNIADEDRIEWLFRELGRIGFDVEEIEDFDSAESVVEAVAERIEDPGIFARINAKTNSEGFQNFYVDKLVDAEDIEDEDEDDEDDGDELDEMDRKELKAYIKDNDLDIKVTKKMSDDDIRDAIVEAEEDDGEDGDEDGDEFDDMDMKALKKHIKANDLGIRVSSKMSEDDVREKIRDAIPEDEDEDEDEDDEDDGDEDFEFEKGDRVSVEYRKASREGTVVKVDDDQQKASVKLDYNKKTVEFDFNALELLDDDDDDDEPASKKKRK